MIAIRNGQVVPALTKAKEIASAIGGIVRKQTENDSPDQQAIEKAGELVASVSSNNLYDVAFTLEAQIVINKWCLENNYK